MIELIQFPWSPFCIVQRRILEYSGTPFKITNVSNVDRSLVWRLTRQRYYAVPVLKAGRQVIFETDELSQVIAKYLDERLQLGLFPPHWSGLQDLLWRYIENEIEGLTFRLNDIHYREFIPKKEILPFVRHKERKFGAGCLELWREQEPALLEQLAQRLVPLEQMLLHRSFLLEEVPRFVDFDLYGMLGNFLYTGHYQLPAQHTGIKGWYDRMQNIKKVAPSREKLRP